MVWRGQNRCNCAFLNSKKQSIIEEIWIIFTYMHYATRLYQVIWVERSAPISTVSVQQLMNILSRRNYWKIEIMWMMRVRCWMHVICSIVNALNSRLMYSLSRMPTSHWNRIRFVHLQLCVFLFRLVRLVPIFSTRIARNELNPLWRRRYTGNVYSQRH